MPDELLPRFTCVPAGEFVMGSDDGREDERPTRRIHLDTFHLSVHPVTNQQYAEFVRATGYPAPAVRDLPTLVTPAHELEFRKLAAPFVWRGGHVPHQRARHPVTLVGYRDAMAYCDWLAGRIGEHVRLPSEAEWERAARGGLERMQYPWGEEIDPGRANFLLDPSVKRYRGTRPVGSYVPNAFGLYDMAGNVWEWVADWYAATAYECGQIHNPRGPAEGRLRLVRGGSWVTSDVFQLRCAHRHPVPADTYTYSIGFRVAYSGADDV